MITGLGSAKDLASGKKGAFYNTLEEFHKYWDRIDIISPKLTSLQAYKLTSLFGNVFIHVSPWPLIFHPIWFIKKALSLHRENKFDLMTVHEFPPFYNGIGARLIWNKIRVPYILELLHIPGYPRAANIKETIYKQLLRWFVRFDSSRAKAIRVMNKSQVPDFLIKAGVSPDKIKYIPAIYLDLDIYKPMNLEKEYDLIFIGRLESNKGVDLFIKAVKLLDARAIIVGHGSLLKTLNFKLETLNLQDKVLLHGWAKDNKEIAKLINQSRLLVMTSYNEGGPRVVFEAMACGVPVLATPVGLVPDYLSSVTMIDWNADDIASKAKRLLSDDAYYEGMRIQGLAVARQFDRKSAIRNYADELKNLVAKSTYQALPGK